MRVLWITNNPLPEFLSRVTGKPALGGSWLSPLAWELSQQTDIKLAVVTNVPGATWQKLEENSITQYIIPIKKKDGLVINDLYPELIQYYQQVENDFEPDIIHIHGTERYFGLLSARKFLKAPTIISIQGIITSYFDYMLGGIEEKKLKSKRSIKNLLSKGGIINQRKIYKKYIPVETEILRNNSHFFCRTSWDRSQVMMFNNKSTILQGEELLRKSFYTSRWSISKIERNSIFISSGTIPIKGLHVLLKAAAILKTHYPDITIRIPLDPKKFYRKSALSSNDYEIYLNELIDKHDLRRNISLHGTLSEERMAATMATSHVFVLPSFNENSPNSLGEAMMVGTPSVVSPVGGVPDMVINNESALYSPPGDAAMLAHQIGKILASDTLAAYLSENARSIALRRHDIPSTIAQYKSAYLNVSEPAYAFTR